METITWLQLLQVSFSTIQLYPGRSLHALAKDRKFPKFLFIDFNHKFYTAYNLTKSSFLHNQDLLCERQLHK